MADGVRDAAPCHALLGDYLGGFWEDLLAMLA
jgi:hypothetical protein